MTSLFFKEIKDKNSRGSEVPYLCLLAGHKDLILYESFKYLLNNKDSKIPLDIGRSMGLGPCKCFSS